MVYFGEISFYSNQIVGFSICRVYALFLSVWQERSGSSSPSQMQALIAGGIAGAVFWTANYPGMFDYWSLLGVYIFRNNLKLYCNAVITMG